MTSEMDGQVAVKVVAPGVLHKSDIGCGRLHLKDPRAVEQATIEMAEAVRQATGAKPNGYIVQRMAPAGVEMLVGVVNDRQFGPTIACGTLVELLKDVSVRLTPLTCADASSMLGERM